MAPQLISQRWPLHTQSDHCCEHRSTQLSRTRPFSVTVTVTFNTGCHPLSCDVQSLAISLIYYTVHISHCWRPPALPSRRLACRTILAHDGHIITLAASVFKAVSAPSCLPLAPLILATIALLNLLADCHTRIPSALYRLVLCVFFLWRLMAAHQGLIQTEGLY
jgi:hypothetical protein